jgi:phosphatidate cytidylyltransferase
MQTMVLVILFFMLAGGAGMALANKKVAASVARQRWIKYFSYILITFTVLVAIRFGFFRVVAVLIAGFGFYEVAHTWKRKKARAIAALGVYSILVIGFLAFAFQVSYRVQFFVYFLVLSFDAFCQISGQLIGRKPLAPRISPSKTWEGLAGGVFFCVLASVLCRRWLLAGVDQSIYFGLIIAVTAFAGDMLASCYKRMAGIKDYSNLLPGQGGFLDRFDSFLMTGACYALACLVVPGLAYYDLID